MFRSFMKTGLVVGIFCVMVFTAATQADAPGSYAAAFERGDQTISLSTGFQIPLAIIPSDPSATESATLKLGGGFGFTYQYFLSKHLAVGGSLAGAFNGTLGGRTLFAVPLAARVAWWWTSASLQTGISVEAGAYLMRLDSHGMIGPFLKAGPELGWKLTREWSVGARLSSWLIPEIHTGTDSDKTRYGLFGEVSVMATYHL